MSVADESRVAFIKLLTKRNVKDNKLICKPKTSLEVLTDLKSESVFTLINSKDNLVTIRVKINEKSFIGKGLNKNDAAEEAAEKALQYLFFDIIVRTAISTNENDKCQYDTYSWKSLASLATYKLMKEWLIFYNADQTYKHCLKNYITKSNLVNQDDNCDNVISTSNTCNCIDLLNKLCKQNLHFEDFFIYNDKSYKSKLVINGIQYTSDPSKSREGRQSVAKKALFEIYKITCPKTNDNFNNRINSTQKTKQ